MNPDVLLIETKYDALIQAALEVRHKAYAPYSKFQVGAALLSKDGTIVLGTNVENSSYGLTICAERAAATAAVTAGKREFLAIAVATPGGATPCGACRQFLAEFGANLLVFIVDADQSSRVQKTTISDLLPQSFRL